MNGSSDGGPADASGPDAYLPPVAPTHLLITEVCLSPNACEFVEIYNPTTEAVDLSNYYLADDGDYMRLPGEFGAGPEPRSVEGTFDFLLKFPNGASIGPDEVQVMALRYDSFVAKFEMEPTYSFLENTPPERAMVDPGVDRPMTDINPQLHNDGEPVILFYWDGVSDLVKDVDVIVAGSPSDLNLPADKTNVAVDGPDEGEEATTYKRDLFILGRLLAGAQVELSHKRIRLESRFEKQDGTGNGITGDDETSEDINRTWDDVGSFSPPTPGQIPQELRQR